MHRSTSNKDMRMGPRGGGGRPEPELRSAEGVAGWFAGRVPEDWFIGAPEVVVDRDEILVVGELAAPDLSPEASDTDRTAAEQGRVQRFREATRAQRMQLADEAEARFGRKVAWGAQAGQTRQTFTTLSVPVMTRLRQEERRVLDTLVEAGVARSRSDALVWSVRLVGEHSATWLAELRTSLEAVQRLRDQGPDGT